jgi:ribosomal-protein-alanine N-acetyltransferase
VVPELLVLTTARLRLQPAQPAHAPALFAQMSDSRLTEFLAWEPHTEIAQTAGLLEQLSDAHERGTAFHWTVFDGDSAVGLVSLIDVRRTHRLWRLERAEIAYWIAVSAQGHGFATEATAAVVAAAFERLGLHRLIISHTGSNPGSGRIPQKLGFRYIGREEDFFMKNGVWHDMHHYELRAEDRR